MGVTNGFLKLSQDEFQQLCGDQNAFEKRLRDVHDGDSDDYLYMDKAGPELLFLMIDTESELSQGVRALYPHILTVLGGDGELGPGLQVFPDEDIFPNVDMGYGPARMVHQNALRNSIKEFDNLDYDTMHALAMDSDVIADYNKEEFRDYDWEYLKALGEFVKDAVAKKLVVLRY